MVRDAIERISVAEANAIAQDRSRGRLSVAADGSLIHLCCDGSSITIDLHPVFDMTEIEIERQVDEYQDAWPKLTTQQDSSVPLPDVDKSRRGWPSPRDPRL